jgi:hypothetical protein
MKKELVDTYCMCEKIRNEYNILAVKRQAQRSVEVPAGVLEDNIEMMTVEDSLPERSNFFKLNCNFWNVTVY